VTVPARILVVEDDPDVRDLITSTLEDLDFSVEAAVDGLEALLHVTTSPPDLILLDLRMPRMNGREFADRYHALPGPRAPIVVVSAASDSQVQAADLGATAWLGKPFALVDLVALVRRHLVVGAK
jgi:CheY-like chemotaxis protein